MSCTEKCYDVCQCNREEEERLARLEDKYAESLGFVQGAVCIWYPDVHRNTMNGRTIPRYEPRYRYLSRNACYNFDGPMEITLMSSGAWPQFKVDYKNIIRDCSAYYKYLEIKKDFKQKLSEAF